MTSLSAIEIPSKSVKVSEKQYLTVYGLSFDDIKYLISEHRDEAQAIVNLFYELGGERSMTSLITEFMESFSDIAALTIALGVKDKSGHKQAAALPFYIQVECLVACFQLTIQSLEHLKKILAMVGIDLSAQTEKGKE